MLTIAKVQEHDQKYGSTFIESLDTAIIGSCSKIQDRNTFWVEAMIYGIRMAITRHRAVANGPMPQVYAVLMAIDSKIK